VRRYDPHRVPTFALIAAGSANAETSLKRSYNVSIGPALSEPLSAAKIVGELQFEVTNMTDVLGESPSFRDRLGARRWAPLNIAYVDERRELFAFAPERLVFSLRHASALRALNDTLIGGQAHARLATTVDGWPSTVFVRRSDALPATVRFRADEKADFGLPPWGVHEVEFWYSDWQTVPGGALLPRQRDVRRFGHPYKRMTVLAMQVNAPTPPECD